MNGFTVKFYTTASLAIELVEASEYKSLSKLEKQLSKVTLNSSYFLLSAFLRTYVGLV